MQRTSSIRDAIKASETQIEGLRKVTLTNLFQNELFSKNLVPESNKPRPQTMQIGRSKNPRLQSSNYKQSAQTQMKRQYTQSLEKQSARYYSSVELKISESDKLRVRKVYGRMNILADGVQMEQTKEITSIFDFISTLSETNNHHQKVFAYLEARLKELVYVDSQIQGLKQLAQKTKNNLIGIQSNSLVKIAMKRIVGPIYKDLCIELVKESKKIMQDKFELERSNAKMAQQLNLTVIEKDDIISKLKQQLLYYMEHPSQDLYPYIENLENQNVQLKRQLRRIQQLNLQLETQAELYRNTNVILADKIQQLKTQIYQFQIEKLSSMKDVEKNSELTDFTNNVQNLKSMLHKSVLRMEGVKQQYEKVKNYNEELITERSKLAKRAAVGFQQLTPRPKFKKIFEENNLDFDKLIDPQPSTDNIVQLLVKTCKQLFGDKKIGLLTAHIQNKKKQQERQQPKKKKNKPMPDKAIDDIIEASQQVVKTVLSAQQVKKAFNKEKNKREILQSNRGK